MEDESMALVTTTDMFKKAYEGGYAIGALHILGVDVNKLADLDIVLTNTQHQVQRKVQRKVWSKGLE